MHSLGVLLFMSLLFLEPAPNMYTYAVLHYAFGCFMSLFCFDLLVHVAPAGAPAWAMRLCQGIHVIFLLQIAELQQPVAAPASSSAGQ